MLDFFDLFSGRKEPPPEYPPLKFCNLFSGSSGNASFISFGQTKLLLDAGLSGKTIRNALNEIGEDAAQLTAIIITHEHSDHTRGVGVLARKYKIPVFASGGTWKSMRNWIGPLPDDTERLFHGNAEFEIGGIGVRAFSIPHDASEPVAFSFFAARRKISVATDIGHLTDRLLGCIESSDVLLIESNHDIEMLKKGSYPYPLKQRILGKYGHLSNEVAAGIVCHAIKKGTKHFLLGHLSAENNIPKLAYSTTEQALKKLGVTIGKECHLSVAHRDKVSTPIIL